MSTAPIPVAPQPPRKSNNTVWWILGILGGGFAILILLGLIVAAIFIRNVRVNEASKKMEIETPVGSLKVKSGDERTTGLPIYPGSTPEKSDNANIQVSLPQGQSVGVAAEKYLTQDDLEKVTTWYAKRLGSGFRREDHDSAARARPHGSGRRGRLLRLRNLRRRSCRRSEANKLRRGNFARSRRQARSSII